MNRATRDNVGHVLKSNNSTAGLLHANDLHFTTQAELLGTCQSTSQSCWPRCNKPKIDIMKTIATNRHAKHPAISRHIRVRALSPRIQDRSIHVTMCCCGLGSSEFRDCRTLNMRETARIKKGAEQHEPAAERPLDRRVGTTQNQKQPLRDLGSALRRETRNLLERIIRNGMLHVPIDQKKKTTESQCLFSIKSDFKISKNDFAPPRHSAAQPFPLVRTWFLEL